MHIGVSPGNMQRGVIYAHMCHMHTRVSYARWCHRGTYTRVPYAHRGVTCTKVSYAHVSPGYIHGCRNVKVTS